jgi:hypothetical protein
VFEDSSGSENGDFTPNQRDVNNKWGIVLVCMRIFGYHYSTKYHGIRHLRAMSPEPVPNLPSVGKLVHPTEEPIHGPGFFDSPRARVDAVFVRPSLSADHNLRLPRAITGCTPIAKSLSTRDSDIVNFWGARNLLIMGK